MTDTTASPATPALKTFADFDVDARICAALADAGIVNPFPIQELTLPLALAGADLIGQARTGTGKTLAFGIPLLERALRAQGKGPSALVIVPTRELCLQVRDDLAAAGAQTDVEVVAVYGGKSIDVQVEALQKGAGVVVGTPGRLLDLLGRGSLNLSGVTGLVLDEADEMLDLGFLPDVEQLIQATATQRQTLLFSATMPSAVVGLARRYMNKPTFMRADVEEVRIGPDTVQHFFSCHRMDKPAVLARILQSPGRGLCVVFSRTKRMADVLVEELRSRGLNAAAIHSDLRQEARERALQSFRNGKTDVLVATEVAARGLDISDVTHVVNYDCPDDEKMYLHRIGRTGRAGAAGVAITLAVWNELARLEMIKKALGIQQETHEVFSTSPMLEDLFDLPPNVKASRSKPAAAPDKPSRTEPRGTPSSERPQDTDEGAPRRRQSRRRGGARRTSRTPVATEAAESVEAPSTTPVPEPAEPAEPASADRAAADVGPGADGETVVRRVRTRRRQEPGTPRPAAPPPPADSRRPAADDTSSSDQRTGDDERGAAASADRGDTPTQAPTRRSTSGRSSPARRPRERSTSRSETGRSPRSSRQSRPARGGNRSTPAVDSDTARGDGQPRLSRPLVISYLP